MPTSRELQFNRFKQFVRPDLLAWAFILIAGFGWLLTYEMKAGEPAPALADWPRDAGLPFEAQKSNLVMFAHPKCPCTRASLAELATIMARGGRPVSATVCFYDPAGAPADWTDTSLIRAAREIPGVSVVIDHDGAAAARFGALTSGQVLLFNNAGQGVFSGGITGSRGHVGENRGRSLVLAFAAGEPVEPARTPVYGCGLHDAVCSEGCAP